jgi:hypothetical protein
VYIPGYGPKAHHLVGAALVKWPKYFFVQITMKLASLVEIALLIIYHQGTKKFLTGRPSFSAKRVEKVDFTSDWTSDSTNIGHYGAVTCST